MHRAFPEPLRPSSATSPATASATPCASSKCCARCGRGGRIARCTSVRPCRGGSSSRAAQPVHPRTGRLDVGAVQRDSLSLDPEATLRAYAATGGRHGAADRRGGRGARAAASHTGVCRHPGAGVRHRPSARCAGRGDDQLLVGLDLCRLRARFSGLPAAGRRAARLVRAGDPVAAPALPRRLERVPAHPGHSIGGATRRLDRRDTRRRLGLPPHDRLVLLSFGGIGIELAGAPTAPRGVTFVATQSATDGAPLPPRCRFISNADLAAHGVRYEDLVAAADVVMTKPGYGIVADCIANGTAMIYTSRGRFAEYDCLVRGIEAHLPHAFISNEDLYAGRWTGASTRCWRNRGARRRSMSGRRRGGGAGMRK